MKLVKEVLPNGKVRLTRTYYVIFWAVVVGDIVAAAGLALALVSR